MDLDRKPSERQIERLLDKLGMRLFESTCVDLGGLNDNIHQRIEAGQFKRFMFWGMGCSSVVSDLVPDFSSLSVSIELDEPGGGHRVSAIEGWKGYVLNATVSSGPSGAQSIHVEFEAALADAVTAAINRSDLHNARHLGWILQQHVSSALCSLVGYVEDGSPVFIGFSMRNRIRFTELNNTFPACGLIAEHLRRRCQDRCRRLSSTPAFPRGTSTAGSYSYVKAAMLIDANLGRISGPGIVEQIAIAHGLAPGDILSHVILLPFGKDLPAPKYKLTGECDETTGSWYGLKEGGIVQGWEIPETLASVHTHCALSGCWSDSVGVFNFAWVEMIIGSSDTVSRDARTLRILTDDDFQPAFFYDAPKAHQVSA